METGDTFTIAGVNRMVPNTSRKWWQFWKPRMIDSSETAKFEVTDITGFKIKAIGSLVYAEWHQNQREENQRLSRLVNKLVL